MKGSVVYKGERLARNSEAYTLWEAKEFKKLDAHLARVNFEAIERGEILEPTRSRRMRDAGFTRRVVPGKTAGGLMLDPEGTEDDQPDQPTR